MYSCFQNAWLLINTMTTPIITFRERPCMPAKAAEHLADEMCDCVRITSPDGLITEWFKDGIVQETWPNGDKTIFPGKPTYESFRYGTYRFAEFYLGYLTVQSQFSGNYFEFHKNGAVVYRHNHRSFLWSPPFPAKEVVGDITYSLLEFDDNETLLRERCDSYS